METVANISLFLNNCGLQSIEGISCFWAPHLYESMTSDNVFVTDLSGIRVLSPNRHTDISRSVSCVSKETKVSKSWCSVSEQCAPCIYLCVHPLLLSAEGGRSAHQGASQAMQALQIRNVGQCWELRAPAAIRHLKLSWPRIKNSPLICEEACVSSKVNQSLYFRLPA